ncbi:glycosyltransferase family protein [Anaeromicropila populeti]|uniref:Glycosyl transferase family 2 n=1 Tax=Anaeromicropila populeti TaxID=37658 RepID=A0A1I6JBX5_9FIRM|nr:hypothetical protein [Anaeromicropila populeti]SFR76442.1 hypothetical protein SAMN05661086_01541 [Anaeromicropila populeti]
MDSDDEWFPEHLEECVKAIEVTDYSICSALWIEEKAGKLYSLNEYEWFVDSKKRIEMDLNIDINRKVWVFDERFFCYTLCTGFYCYHINTIVLKREIIKQVGFFNEKMKSNEDMEFLRGCNKFCVFKAPQYQLNCLKS